jgi:uncharacterized protein YoxC
MFGSTDDGDPIDIKKIQERLTTAEAATVKGLAVEMEIIKQKMTALYEKLNRIHNTISTFSNQVRELEAARIRELSLKVNGGPTERE